MTTFRIVVFLLAFIFLFMRESQFPKRTLRHPRSHRFAFHLIFAGINSIILRWVGAAPLFFLLTRGGELGFGVVRGFLLTGWLEVLFSIAALDLAHYFWHRMSHQVPWLWALHKVHHSDTDLDIFTSIRTHPIEFLCTYLFKAAVVFMIGPSVLAFGIYEMLYMVSAQFHHANIELPVSWDAKLRMAIVTPKVHLAHHTVTPWSRNGNYSPVFLIWDFLFRTYRVPEKENLSRLGLEWGRTEVLNIRTQMRAPFRSELG